MDQPDRSASPVGGQPAAANAARMVAASAGVPTGSLAALAHELQTAVQVQNLDTVAAAFEDTAQKVVIISQASASRP